MNNSASTVCTAQEAGNPTHPAEGGIELEKKEMKTRPIVIMILGFIIILTARCSKNYTQIQGPSNQTDLNTITYSHSMKGWELYSWPDDTDWNYSILVGTNRVKSYDEVTTNELIVTGKDSLKMILGRLPEGEMIAWLGSGWLERSWGDNFKNLSLPPKTIQEEIKEYCSDHNLTLQIIE